MSEAEFLANYWEKRPIVLRNVIDDPETIVDEKDLLTMALDEDYETRMIRKENNWEVFQGPFTEDAFNNKNKFWTLIVHNMNLYFPRIKQLEKAVEFIPKWLFDDVMCTYSTKGSSVGAHIDNYNVFILQTSGQRRWSIQHEPNKAFQDNIDVKILKEFKADEEFILNPGDMIYIPPHVAHWGESLTQSCSLSIGFKSLEDKDLLDSLCLGIISEEVEQEQFIKTNFKNSHREKPFHIGEKLITNLYDKVFEKLNRKDIFEKVLLKNLSTPKKVFEENELAYEEFLSYLNEMPLYKDEFCRGVILDKNNIIKVSINTLDFQIESDYREDIESFLLLDHNTPIEKVTIENNTNLFYQLYLQGSIYFSEE